MRAYADNDYPANHKPDWKIIAGLWPYLAEFRGRVVLSVVLLVMAKLATVATPVALKYIVDYLDTTSSEQILLWIPVMLVVAYGLLRFGSTLFSELRDAVFARVAERAMRRVSLRVFRHLHQLALGFHLDRKTGGLARDIERGTNGISFLLRFTLFNIIPTILEILMVSAILLWAFSLAMCWPSWWRWWCMWCSPSASRNGAPALFGKPTPGTTSPIPVRWTACSTTRR